jgi:hypothetical protein
MEATPAVKTSRQLGLLGPLLLFYPVAGETTMRPFLRALPLVLILGCTSMNDALTPSLQLMKDDFDGALIVRQAPVSAASGLADAWHTLGFEWTQKTPNAVYVTAGVQGITNIYQLAFNADGHIIENLKTASAHTDYGQWSTRRFSMTWDDFLALANAKEVKMRVSRANEYTVSSFGPAHPNALVNAKLVPFVAKVRDLRATLK